MKTMTWAPLNSEQCDELLDRARCVAFLFQECGVERTPKQVLDIFVNQMDFGPHELLRFVRALCHKQWMVPTILNEYLADASLMEEEG